METTTAMCRKITHAIYKQMTNNVRWECRISPVGRQSSSCQIVWILNVVQNQDTFLVRYSNSPLSHMTFTIQKWTPSIC